MAYRTAVTTDASRPRQAGYAFPRLVDQFRRRAWLMRRLVREVFRPALVRMIAVLLVCVFGSFAQAEPTSIAEFLAREAQFGDLVGSTFNLEGRASTLTGNELRMKGTNLKFVFETSLERPRTFPYVQLVGRLERDGRDFRVIVKSLSDYKPEADVIRDRLRAADTTIPESYYQLADWSEERAKFYTDDSLHEEARRLRTLGIQAAQRRTQADESSVFLALADKAAQWGLDPRLRMELLHAATRADLSTEAKNRVPAYSAVLNRIKTRFAGSDQPLAEIPQPIQAMYAARPESSYAQADDEQRVTLQRLLYIETALKLAAQDARPDGSNGYAVAANIARLVPEYPELAAQHRAKELDYLESRINSLDRAAVLEFRNKLRKADQPERATAAVRKWIDAQLSRRAKSPNSPDTLIDRAQLEYELNGDAGRALALVASAMALDPQALGGAELLALMGYGWYEGKAVRKELIPPPPPDPFAQAIQDGRVMVGMSEQQARAALGGAPETVVRLASQGRVTELWHFSNQRLTLHLDANRQKPQLAVSRIVEMTEDEK